MAAMDTSERRDLKLAAVALLFGIGFDVLFYDKPLGISYPLFVLSMLVYFVRCLPARIAVKADFRMFLLASVILLSMTFALFNNPVLRALNMAAVPVLAVLFAEQAAGLHSAGSPWGLQRIAAALRRLLVRSISAMPVGLRIPARHLRQRTDAGRFQPVFKIAIGLLLSLPLVILAGALLSSADKLFQQTLQQVPDWFRDVPLGEIVYRILIIVIVACYIFGLIWSFRKDVEKGAQREEISRQNGTRFLPAIDPIITATVLISVNAVYVLFAVVQFAYLFGGGQGLLPDGMTYAEYARRGFGEVTFVSVINFGLMLVTLFITPAGGHLAGKLVRPVLGLLTANTAVMLISAYVRLDMYEAAYGYTYTRFFVNSFLLWLGSMLIVMLLKIIRPGKELFRTAFIVTVSAYLLLNYVNVDAVIAGQNIQRYHASGRIDWNYLNGLSYDAVPSLMKLSTDKEGAIYLKQGFARKKEQLTNEASWPSFNVAKYRAKRIIQD